MAKVRWHLPALSLCYGLVVCLLVAFLVPAPWLTTALLVLSPLLLAAGVASGIVLWQLASYLRGRLQLACPNCRRQAAARDFDGQRVVLDCDRCGKLRVIPGWLGTLSATALSARQAPGERDPLVLHRMAFWNAARSPLINSVVLAPSIASTLIVAASGKLNLLAAMASLGMCWVAGIILYVGLRDGVTYKRDRLITRSKSPVMFWIDICGSFILYGVGVFISSIPMTA